MDALFAVPEPRNEVVRDYAPGSGQATSLQKRLGELAGTPVDLTMTIDGKQRMAGGDAINVVAAAPARARARRDPQRHPRRRRRRGRRRQERRADVAGHALRRPGRDLPARRRPARRAVARHRSTARPCSASRRRPTRPRSTRPASSSTSCASTSAFGAKLLAEQPHVVAGRVEPVRPPAAGRLRLRDHAVQLHRDRGQPADHAGADRQHRGLEAVGDAAVRGAPHDAPAGGGRPAAGRDQHGHRATASRSATSRLPTPTWPASTSPGRRRSSSTCGARSARTSRTTAPTRGSSARPAARTSSSRTRPPTSTRCSRR